METGLDSSTERVISTNLKVTTEEFVEWKRKIHQAVDNKTGSLKHRIKVYKANPVMDQVDNNIAIVWKKGILDTGNEMCQKIKPGHLFYSFGNV